MTTRKSSVAQQQRLNLGDYVVGRGKPPNATKFRPGTSGNPKGRPKRTPSLVGNIVDDILNSSVRYRENGRVRLATRREVALKQLVQRAISGDVEAADLIQRKRAVALRRANAGSDQLVIDDWLPDFEGQTAAQKNQSLASAAPSGPATPSPIDSDNQQEEDKRVPHCRERP
jgi:hypothetical protein